MWHFTVIFINFIHGTQITNMNTTEEHMNFMRVAVEHSKASVRTGGGPFGAVIMQNGVIVGEGNNMVTITNDPTAHAEVVAIRNACANLNTFQLTDCTLYTSCEPCPMCLGAIYWARLGKVYFGCGRTDAERIGFDDAFIYTEIGREHGDREIAFEQLLRDEALEAFALWTEKEDKTAY